MTTEFISANDLKKVLDSADKALNECFDMLLDFRHAENDIGKVILQFQPLLAETLFNLMEFYKKLSQEKSILISEKKNYREDVFLTEIARNGRFMKAVSLAIEIGKSMGDAFAWFFYRDNHEELEKHFQHPSTGLYVSGIGGRGELEFIKKSLDIDGFYVLYHGITTMLRIGDFSLYDFHHGIVGLGELKTKRVGDKLQITAVISAKANIRVPNQSNLKQNPFEEQLIFLKKEFPRIEKQLRTQISFLKRTAADATALCQSSYEYDMIDTLTPEIPYALSSDRSLMVIATWSKYQTLYKVLTEKEEFPGLPGGAFTESVESMMFPELPYNQFHIGRLNTTSNLLTIPILWWDVNECICKDIYFLRVEITTIFNPSKLLNCFAEDGFSVEISGELNKIKLQKKIGDQKISIGNFASICFLTTNSFMKTNDAYSFVKQVIDEVEKGKFAINSRIDMHIYLDNFGQHDSDITKGNESVRKEHSDGQTENAHDE